MEIKNLRINNNKKPEDLAKMLCISLQAYYKYEKEVNEPNIQNLCKLADLYNVSLDYLVGREFKDDIGYLTPDQKNVLYVIKQLNEKNLATILGQSLRLLNEQ